MSKEDHYRENIAWLSRLMDDGFPRVAWTTQPMSYHLPNIMRSMMEKEWFIGKVSDTISVCVCHTTTQLESFCHNFHAHRGWPIEIPRMGVVAEKKKVDYARITREIVGDLR